MRCADFGAMKFGCFNEIMRNERHVAGMMQPVRYHQRPTHRTDMINYNEKCVRQCLEEKKQKLQ